MVIVLARGPVLLFPHFNKLTFTQFAAREIFGVLRFLQWVPIVEHPVRGNHFATE